MRETRQPVFVLPILMKRLIAIIAVLGLSALTAGCASLRPIVSSPEAVMIKSVPFFKQEPYQCGPAALAMVLDYWYQKEGKGRRITPEEIAARIYSPSARGALGIDLEIYAGKQGFQVHSSSGDLDRLKALVDDGIPPIIFVDYGFLSYAAHHFMVVTGYCDAGVIVNSGKEEGRLISAKELDRIWKRNDYWMLVVKPSF